MQEDDYYGRPHLHDLFPDLQRGMLHDYGNDDDRPEDMVECNHTHCGDVAFEDLEDADDEEVDALMPDEDPNEQYQ